MGVSMSLAVFALLVACGGSGDVKSKDGGGDPTVTDTDGDGIADGTDNCLGASNADQADLDGDGIGDACDTDTDNDGVADPDDNCRGSVNLDQADADGDGVGDLCDNCPAAQNTDQADGDTNGIGDACPCDACAGGEWCTLQPDTPTVAACVTECTREQQADNQVCCPLGSRRSNADGLCHYGDIQLDTDRLMTSIKIDHEYIDEKNCEYIEGCVNGTGTRQLIRFDTRTPNHGDGDIFLGDPADNTDIFVWSGCHQHYHFTSYAKYELLDTLGNVVAPGNKQAFCLEDFDAPAGYTFADGTYNCNYQGISVGWADTYDSYLDCQFLDVTGVAPGDYTLRITMNGDHVIAESDFTNNMSEVPLTLPDLPDGGGGGGTGTGGTGN